MGIHDYESDVYNGNLQTLYNCVAKVNQTILPSDPSSQFSFAYSMEITSFNRILSDLQEICTKSVSAYEKAKGEVCVADADSAAKMADPISDLATLTNTLNNITSVMSGANAGGQVLNCVQCNTIIEANSKITEYLNFDDNTKSYNYNWVNIGKLLQSDADELSESDYYILVEILLTMSSAEGKVNCEYLQNFVDLGYTNSQISKYDYKKSWVYTAFNPSGNDREDIRYISNVANLSQTFINTVYLYEKLTESESTDGTYSLELKNILENVVEYFPSIEWRKRIYDSDIVLEGNIWSGGVYVINSEVLDSFNNDCKAHVSISLSKDASYYEMSSNSYNQGNVVLTEDNGSMLHQLSASEDGYTDYTIKYYIKCDENETSDMTALGYFSKDKLRCFYQKFDMEEKVASKIVDFAASFIPNGSVFVDKGISIATDFLGILSEKNKVDLNNMSMDNCITQIEEYEKEIKQQENLGVRHKTLIIAENHVQYDNSHAYVNEVTVDKSKAFSTDVIESDTVFDKDLLSKQYAYIVYKFKEDDYVESEEFKAEVETLSTQIKEYLQTGKVIEGSLLDSYIKKMNISN